MFPARKGREDYVIPEVPRWHQVVVPEDLDLSAAIPLADKVPVLDSP